jgi:phospholipid/cholesterol/gamma-HCH transport system substrate-binding protein
VPRKIIEVMVGFLMLLGIAALVFLALKVSGLTSYSSQESYYRIIAEFDNVGSLKVRAPVMIAGVKIGQVGAINLDPVSFRAKVALLIRNDQNRLPSDTSASIYTQGLLGANYVSLTPGYASTYLKGNSHIETTQPAIILEKLIGQFLFNLQKK